MTMNANDDVDRERRMISPITSFGRRTDYGKSGWRGVVEYAVSCVSPDGDYKMSVNLPVEYKRHDEVNKYGNPGCTCVSGDGRRGRRNVAEGGEW
jgi:hypothetical protein